MNSGPGATLAPAIEPAVADQARSLLHAARHFHEGAAALAENRPLRGGVAMAFLAAQAVEYALKSYLLMRGESPDDLKNRYRRDLDKLWAGAARHGLPVAARPPHWCELLNEGHGTPFRFKFPEYLGAIVTPGPEPLMAGVGEVLGIVSAALAQGEMQQRRSRPRSLYGVKDVG